MAHFINDRAGPVTDAIDGLLAASGGRLVRLDGDPDIHVVLRVEREGARATAAMERAATGRSGDLAPADLAPSDLAGHEDSGAAAVATMFEALAGA